MRRHFERCYPQSSYKIRIIDAKCVIFSISTVAADDLTPIGSRPFLGSQMTKLRCLYIPNRQMKGLISHNFGIFNTIASHIFSHKELRCYSIKVFFCWRKSVKSQTRKQSFSFNNNNNNNNNNNFIAKHTIHEDNNSYEPFQASMENDSCENDIQVFYVESSS